MNKRLVFFKNNELNAKLMIRINLEFLFHQEILISNCFKYVSRPYLTNCMNIKRELKCFQFIKKLTSTTEKNTMSV